MLDNNCASRTLFAWISPSSFSYFAGAQIIKRHTFLTRLIGTKPEENLSYENTIEVLKVTTVVMILLCILEPATYFLYNSKVSYHKSG